MARSNTIRTIRSTRANLNSQAGANNLLQGEPYLITDEDRFALGLGVSTYQTFMKSGEAITASQLPAHTGDVTSSAGSAALTLAGVNSNTGSFGTGTAIPVLTVNSKGLVTAVSTVAPSTFTSTTAGVAPASGGGTTNYLRADGTWAAPASGGGGGTTTNALTFSTTGNGDTTSFNGAAARTISWNSVGATPLTIASSVSPANRAWAPTDITSGQVVGWWDANTAGSMTLSSSSVTEWRSRVSGIMANNTFTPQCPTYSATALNSKPGLTFDGNMFLNISSVQPFPMGIQNGHIFIVARATSSTSGFVRQAFGYGGGASSGGARVVGTNTDDGFIYDAGGGINTTITGTTAKWFGNTRIVNCANTGGGATITQSVDGGTFTSSTFGTTITDNYLSGRIGHWELFGGAFVGIIQEIIVVTGALSTTDVQQMDGYLAAKWGIQANLPSAHPYKSTAPTITPATYTAVTQNSGANPVELTAATARITGNTNITGNVTAANLSGLNTGDQYLWFTGDAVGQGTDTIGLSLATVNSNVGTFGSGVLIPRLTVDGKGRITSVTTVAPSTFTSSTAGVVPASGGSTSNFLRADGTWTAPTASASTTTGFLDFTNTAPGLPSSGSARVFRADVGGREMIRVVGDDGDFATMQPHIGRNNAHMMTPIFGSAAFLMFGMPGVTTLGTATARTWASTSRFTRTRRLGYVSTAAVGAMAGVYTTVYQCSTGDTSTGSGGFHFTVRFGSVDSSGLTSQTMFLGLANSIAAPSTNALTTLTQHIGVGKLSGSSNLCVYGAGTTAQSATDLGTNYPSASASTDLYEFIMFAPAATSPVTWMLTRFLSNGTSINTSGTFGTAGAAAPDASIGLAFRAYRTATVATATGLDIAGVYLETDI